MKGTPAQKQGRRPRLRFWRQAAAALAQAKALGAPEAVLELTVRYPHPAGLEGTLRWREVVRFPGPAPPLPTPAAGARGAEPREAEPGSVPGDLWSMFVDKFYEKAPECLVRVDGHLFWLGYGTVGPAGQRARVLVWHAERCRQMTVAEVSYRLARGAVPPGHHVVPACLERRCVEPAHLKAVDARTARAFYRTVREREQIALPPVERVARRRRARAKAA